MVGYGLFTICEYAVWIAVLVYAYEQGGATEAGIVAIAQLLPGVVVAMLVGPAVERFDAAAVLLAGYGVQALAAGATAAGLYVGADPWLVYAGAVLLSTAVASTRPAQSALLPGVTVAADELTAANVLLGWGESLSILGAGLLTGLLLTIGSVTDVFAGATLLLLTTLVLVWPVRRSVAGASSDEVAREPTAERHRFGLREIWAHGPARVLLSLVAVENVLMGALDVLFVVMAVDLLEAGPAWTGYLNTAAGAGALLFGSLAALFLGRRLGPALVVTAVVTGAALAGTAVADRWAMVALVALVGGGRALFDVAIRVLLQRTVSLAALARIFGVAEALMTLALAAGAAVAPLLVRAGGPRLALVAVAALLPVVVLLRVRAILRVDQHARVPVVELALLRRLPLFRLLPEETLESLAQALERKEFDAGDALVEEGDPGECYYAIAGGTVRISRGGEPVRDLGPGDGLGEIALLRAVPRTATAVATAPVTAYSLDREWFLAALSTYVPAMEQADRLVDRTRADDAERDIHPGDRPA